MPSERFLFLEKTLHEIEVLTTSVDLSEKEFEEKNHELKEIESELESAKNKLGHEIKPMEDYAQTKQSLEEQVSVITQQYQESKNTMHQHAISKLSGLSSKEFRDKNLTSKTTKIKDKSENNRIVIGLTLGLIFAVLSVGVSESIWPNPDFVCYASKEEISYHDVLDGVEDCSDGSDEETSSSFDERTRAELHERGTGWQKFKFFFDILVCGAFCTGGIYLPFGIAAIRKDKVILFEENFTSKHQSDLEKADALERTTKEYQWKLDKIKTTSLKLDQSKLNYVNLKSKINSLEKRDVPNAREMAIQSRKELDNLNSQLEEKWESIADMIPYRNKIL